MNISSRPGKPVASRTEEDELAKQINEVEDFSKRKEQISKHTNVIPDEDRKTRTIRRKQRKFEHLICGNYKPGKPIVLPVNMEVDYLAKQKTRWRISARGEKERRRENSRRSERNKTEANAKPNRKIGNQLQCSWNATSMELECNSSKIGMQIQSQ